ncbi:MAG: hypothetical protein M1838_006038 [Thelocarpon superellum]|nr:MAG: hypothetical protein M1838_006038 [Thelocarpon superellum]
MEAQVQRLVEKTWEKYQQTPPSQRLLIAISGIPGSGKTTLAITVAQRLNQRQLQEQEVLPSDFNPPPPIAAAVPMDGYHLSRAQLSAMPDPRTAHARRGAAFTFNGQAFLILVQQLREPIHATSGTLYAPSFDHALKDPVADDIAIPATSRILLFEGNYLSLSKTPWKEAAALMDELWFVEVDFEVARQRLVRRHVKAGIAPDLAAAHVRVTESDLVNGQEIVNHRLQQIHEMIVSQDDEMWRPEYQGSALVGV